MAEEPKPDSVSDPSPLPAPSGPYRVRFWRKIIQYLDLRLLTERLMTFLRLFASAGLLLIVIFVVYKAILSSRFVLVKPFAVPQTMATSHADSGRVIANLLKQELLDAESDIYNTIKRTNNTAGAIDIEAVTGNSEDYLLGTSIKLPETGISINDVVEFISTLFGRRNIVGSVYQDQGKLFLQEELDGRIFLFQRDLKDRDAKALNMDLIQDMLRESRTKLLSVASESHNLYYYCAGETDIIEHPAGKLSAWFDYCTKLKSTSITPVLLDSVLRDLKSPALRAKAQNSDTLKHILTQTLGTAFDKAKLICPDYAQTDSCQAPAAATTPSVAIQIPVPPPPPQAIPSTPYPTLPDEQAFNAAPEENRQILSIETPTASGADATPQPQLIELPTIGELKRTCDQSAPAKAREKAVSNQLESDATLLFNNNRPVEAAQKYVQAIQQNCANVYAWANLGEVLLAAGVLHNIDEARLALATAAGLNNRVDWIQNDLCITQVWTVPLAQMEQQLTSDACLAARNLNPANKVILDKMFYLAVGERYFTENQFQQAYTTYLTALSADKKRDCKTSQVLEHLLVMSKQHGIKPAWPSACAILQDTTPLPDGRSSPCEQQLANFPCPPAP